MPPTAAPPTGLKIFGLKGENVKTIKIVDLTLDPKKPVQKFTGTNGAGKSTVLNFAQWAINGAKGIDAEVLRHGEKEGFVEVRLGKDAPTITVRRVFTPGGTTVSVEGMGFGSPQALLDTIKSKLTMDPFKFARLKPAERYDMLRQLVPGMDFAAADGANKADYDRRTNLNRQAKESRAAAAQIVPGNPPGPVQDEAALVAELSAVGQKNGAAMAEEQRRRGLNDRLAAISARGATLLAELDALQSEQAKIEADLNAAGPLPATVSTDELQAKINAAREHNRAAERYAADTRRREELTAAAKRLEVQADELTANIETRTAAMKDAIEDANLPVPGITLTDGEIRIGGVLFDGMSDGQKLKASTLIMMASNPAVRAFFIEHGESLAPENLKILADAAGSQDYQVLMEQMDTSGKVGIFLQDGEVAAVNP